MAGTSRAEDLFAELISGVETAIDRFIAEARSEYFFSDYNKSADYGNGPKLHHPVRWHFDKEISGFDNSQSGHSLSAYPSNTMP